MAPGFLDPCEILWVYILIHIILAQVWDLTAGKLLHDFKFHDGPIRSLDFHPLEFLLATGTIKFLIVFVRTYCNDVCQRQQTKNDMINLS